MPAINKRLFFALLLVVITAFVVFQLCQVAVMRKGQEAEITTDTSLQSTRSISSSPTPAIADDTSIKCKPCGVNLEGQCTEADFIGTSCVHSKYWENTKYIGCVDEHFTLQDSCGRIKRDSSGVRLYHNESLGVRFLIVDPLDIFLDTENGVSAEPEQPQDGDRFDWFSLTRQNLNKQDRWSTAVIEFYQRNLKCVNSDEISTFCRTGEERMIDGYPAVGMQTCGDGKGSCSEEYWVFKENMMYEVVASGVGKMSLDSLRFDR